MPTIFLSARPPGDYQPWGVNSLEVDPVIQISLFIVPEFSPACLTAHLRKPYNKDIWYTLYKILLSFSTVEQ